MIEWWHTLTVLQQVFFGIALVASVVLVLQLIMGSVGGDHGLGDLDAGGHGSGLGLLSVQTVSVFLAGFGWVSGVMLKYGFSGFVSTAAGAAFGAAGVAVTIAMMRALMNMQASGTLDYNNAIGIVGTVYCIIPPRRAPGGQVEVVIQGRTVFADAMTDSDQPLPSGSKVRVTSIVARSTLIVERF
jgi:hypothetical protein